MRAYQLPAPGGIDALKIVDLPQPKAKRGQIIVRVKACSLNYRDLAIVLGTYRMGSKADLIPLSDGAGEVVEVGEGVTKFKTGDRVAGNFFQRWSGGTGSADVNTSALGGAIDGMLAEYVALEEQGAVHVPAHLSFEEAATLPCAAVTAWHALRVHGDLIPGRTVLVQGSGGVSVFALQIARMHGARVAAISSSAAKLARLQEMCASLLVNYKDKPEWDKEILALTGGQGVDQVVEIGGAGTFARSLGAIRPGGKISMIGVLAGMAEINPMMIMAKRANVQGIFVGSTQMFEALLGAMSVDGVKPVIDKVFGFNDAKAAYAHMQSASHFGKIVISLA